jgi:hypothetical protein
MCHPHNSCWASIQKEPCLQTQEIELRAVIRKAIRPAIWAVLWAAITLIVFIASFDAMRGYDFLRLALHSEKVSGTVVESEFLYDNKLDNGGTEEFYKNTYKYKVKGKLFYGEFKGSHWEVDGDEPVSIQVRYIPSEPGISGVDWLVPESLLGWCWYVLKNADFTWVGLVIFLVQIIRVIDRLAPIWKPFMAIKVPIINE